MFSSKPSTAPIPEPDFPSDLSLKPIIKISIKERKSEKTLSSSKCSSNCTSQIRTITRPSLKISSHYYKDSKSHSFSPPKDPLPTRTYFFSKLKPVITSTLSSSYRKSSKVYLSNNELVDFLRQKRQINNKNIEITGKSCLKNFNS